MGQVVTLENFRPPRRYDAVPWAEAVIQESLTVDGTFTTIDTITLTPVDADPSEPALRSFTTDQGTAADLWYQVFFQDGSGNVSLPTIPIQNDAADPYATVDELAHKLKIRAPTDLQTIWLQRALVAAAGEINSEIDLAADVELTEWQSALAAEVNLDRAVEHWQESPFGFLDIGGLGAERTARNSWERHAHKLAPLKNQWGFA